MVGSSVLFCLLYCKDNEEQNNSICSWRSALPSFFVVVDVESEGSLGMEK